MIQERTLVNIADNSGGKVGRVFRVLGGTRRRYARIGDQVVLSIQSSVPKKRGQVAVKKKEVLRAVIVRQKAPFKRRDGSSLAFSENAVVIIEKGNKNPRAGRVFGPVPRELQEMGYQKIISLAPEVI